MKTYNASPERAAEDELDFDIRLVCENPVIDGMMKSAVGLAAVLNEYRQILAVNHKLMEMAGLEDPGEILGQRPGEAMNCINSARAPFGCGTTPLCVTCGAAGAIAAGMAGKMPAEKLCALTIEKNGGRRDLCFQARAFPIMIQKKTYILLFLDDVTERQRWTALEQIFFHDLKNIISGIVGFSQLLEYQDGDGLRDMAGKMGKLTLRLSDEINLHRMLFSEQAEPGRFLKERISLRAVMDELKDLCVRHPAAGGKELKIQENVPDIFFRPISPPSSGCS